MSVILAVLGGVVSAHASTKRLHKQVYGSAFAVLGAVAIILVMKQSSESAYADMEQRIRLQDLATASSKMQRSISETARLQTLNADLQKRLLDQSGTISFLARENLSQLTGGTGYCYFDAVLNMGSGNPVTYPLTVWVVGSYPMRNVSATIQALRSANDEVSIRRQLDSWHSIPVGDATILPGPHLLTDRETVGRYAITIWALNGIINEVMDLEIQKGLLTESIEVSRNGKILHREVKGK